MTILQRPLMNVAEKLRAPRVRKAAITAGIGLVLWAVLGFLVRRLSALVAAGTSELFLVMPDAVPDGRLLSELDLAAAHVAVPAVLRDGVPHAPPPEDLRLAAGDTLVLVGAHEDLGLVLTRLETRAAAPAGR